jgi:hypothetical protein
MTPLELAATGALIAAVILLAWALCRTAAHTDHHDQGS